MCRFVFINRSSVPERSFTGRVEYVASSATNLTAQLIDSALNWKPTSSGVSQCSVSRSRSGTGRG